MMRECYSLCCDVSARGNPTTVVTSLLRSQGAAGARESWSLVCVCG
jgi:hypothetical protein